MAPKLSGPKRGSKSLRKRASCEIQKDQTALPESKRPKLIALDNEKKNLQRLEKMETQEASIVEEKQTSNGSNTPDVVSPQNPDLEVNDNSRKVESKIIPSFGKSGGGPKRNASTNLAKSKELSPTGRSELEEKVLGTEENTAMGGSAESVNSPEEFENIVKSLVFKILGLASETASDSCEAALRRICTETSSLLKSCYEIGLEMKQEIIAGSCREAKNIVDAKACDFTTEHCANEKEKNLCQSNIQEDKGEKMTNTLQAGQAIGTKEPSKTDGSTTESKIDLCKTRKEDDDGGCLIVTDEQNIPSEKREVSCARNTAAAKLIFQEVPPKGAKDGESLLQQTKQDRNHEDQQTTSLDKPDVTSDKTSSEQKETSINVVQIQKDVSGTSKGSDELPQHKDIVSGDAKSLSASGHNTEKPTTSSSQANSNERDLPGCVDPLDFTNSQLLQIEEAETEMIQQEASGPSSKGEGNSRPIQRVQDEDIDDVASRRREEEIRDDRRVKEIMQKMMKDLNEIKLVTGSLLSQMTQYRKHRSQRQPQPSRMKGTSSFYRGKQSKGTGSSQFKKS